MKKVFIFILLISMGFSANQNNRSIPKVWGKIIVSIPTAQLPFGVPRGIEISLEADDGSYNRKISTNNNSDLSNALSNGVFYFRDVPVDKNMQFEFRYKSISGRSEVYHAAYKFSYPKLNIVQKRILHKMDKALKIAGYLGDFNISIQDGSIIVTNRYLP